MRRGTSIRVQLGGPSTYCLSFAIVMGRRGAAEEVGRGVTIKVSAIVPVYNPGRRIDRLIASLDRQTLPVHEFEAVFVDDGSTDDTPHVLASAAAARPHFRLKRIENSGWPSRPRNVGIDIARGEYVMFVDHDDEIGDEGLERSYRYAKDNASDVVACKMVATGAKNLDAELFRRNVARADVVADGLLQHLTVHQLFRTEFLRSNGIRFRERVGLLEDHPVAIESYLKAEVVSILADYPVYRWLADPAGGNNSYQPLNLRGYFANIRDSLDVVEAQTTPGPRRDEMLLRWLRGSIAGNLGPKLLRRSEEMRPRLVAGARELVLERFDSRLDDQLPPLHALRMRLLRAGDEEGLIRLARYERATTTRVECLAMTWLDGSLHLRVRSTLVGADGTPMRFVRSGDRILRPVPPGLHDIVNDGAVDVTSALDVTRARVKVQHRQTAVEWFLPTRARVELAGPDSALALELHIQAVFDPRHAALGNPLLAGSWKPVLRTAVLEYNSRRRLALSSGVPQPAIVDNTSVIAYRDKSGGLQVDIEQTARTLAGSARPSFRDVRVGSANGLTILTLRLPRVHVRGDTDLPGSFRLAHMTTGAQVEVPARLTTDEEGGTHLLGEAPLGTGPFTVRATVDGRPGPLFARLDVPPTGAASVWRLDKGVAASSFTGKGRWDAVRRHISAVPTVRSVVRTARSFRARWSTKA